MEALEGLDDFDKTFMKITRPAEKPIHLPRKTRKGQRELRP
jgi:hypothetical protein